MEMTGAQGLRQQSPLQRDVLCCDEVETGVPPSSCLALLQLT